MGGVALFPCQAAAIVRQARRVDPLPEVEAAGGVFLPQPTLLAVGAPTSTFTDLPLMSASSGENGCVPPCDRISDGVGFRTNPKPTFPEGCCRLLAQGPLKHCRAPQ